jgi:sugar phosphate permease
VPPATACKRVSCCRSKDKPEDLGFPPVEPAAEKPKAEGEAKPKPNVLKQLLNNVLKNPFIWGMALTYFFIYIVRQVRLGDGG